MTVRFNLASNGQNLKEPGCLSQTTEIGMQVLNKLLPGTAAGNRSQSSRH